MEFRITRSELLRALTRIQAIVEKRNTMPILANTLIEAEGDKVFISATDLDVGIRGAYGATVASKGSITVSARKLYEITRELPEEETITFRTEENDRVGISCGKIDYKLVGLPPEEYPGLPKGEEKNLAEIQASTLLDMISKTLYAVSTDETRYNLNGLYVETDADKGLMKLVATDGHRLALVTRKVEGVDLTKFDQGVVVPKKGILEVKRLLEEDDEPVKIGFRKGHAVVKKKDVLLVTRLIDAAFPDYNQVLPKKLKFTLKVEREPLLASLRRVSVLSSDKSRSLRMELGEGRLVISSTNPDVGEAREEIAVDYDGEGLSIGFNARYLLDAIGAFDEKDVHLSFNDELSPMKLHPAADEDAVAVVMPMRI